MSRAEGLFLVLFFGLLPPCLAHAQGNYEIQVYGADTVAPKNLMVELHSNYTIKGQQYVNFGLSIVGIN